MCSNHVGDANPRGTVGVVECAAEHRFEIVAALEFPDPPDAPFPGVEPLQTRIREGCGPLLRERLAAGAGQVAYYFAPTGETAWTEGNRTFYCGATTPRQVSG